MKKYLAGAAFIALLSGCGTNSTVVSVGDKEGILNSEGKVLVKPTYKRVSKFKTVENNEYKYPHYLNFHWLHLSGEKYAVVKNIDNKYGIIDEEGNLKLKVVYDSIGQFINGFAKIEVDKKYGLINENFEVVLKPIYDDVRTPLNGTIIVKNYTKDSKSKYGCLNKNMEEVSSLDYDMIFLSSEDRMRIKKDNLWGFMDNECNVVVSPQYKFEKDYSNGLAKVQKTDGLYTYIDLDGKEIVGKTFNQGLDF
ncbi:WG repeat-containing protein [Halarcobacter anaerophilus]|uniref:WG repeat-containing protein n=1 Tax=Halarcobacter anaerophilus TaxID=877500 RepID=A0A4Q0XZN4_9BACT|nr:WG repeat-containing protein [Halarcobacter anaerophilus]QDF30142.1 WG_beta_rep domain-containing protein [Halarcobacter anaerophilus]RXJ63186.1 hypothetical protein CRV06_07955 [Halarcobacter anaerophilus]